MLKFGALISSIGAAASDFFGIISLKILKVASCVVIALAIIRLLPFRLAFPEFVMEIFRSDFFSTLLQTISYFFPVSFALKCLAVLILSKYISLFITIIIQTYRIIVGGLNGN